MAVSSKCSMEERKRLFEQLAIPFHPSEIKWRVHERIDRGSKGLILPFADPRAYTDRLNELFSPAGWTRSYSFSTVSGLTRIKNGRATATGKILLASVVTIHKLGSHTGSGEEWADEENAVTSADAQGFKRACSCFGLGRYLYQFPETWVPLNRDGDAVCVPQLPQWALPPGIVAVDSGTNVGTIRRLTDVRGPIDHKLTANIERFRRLLGDAIFMEILGRAGHSRTARGIPNVERQRTVVEVMEAACRGIERIHELAELAGEAGFIATMDECGISSTNTIPNLAALKGLASALEARTQHDAA